MAWGGAGGGFGGPMGGGGFGGGQFGRGGANAAAQPGLPFAGIPEELQERVETLLETEPDHPKSQAVFTHRRTDRRRLSLRRLLMDHRMTTLVIGVLVVIETVTLLAGPALTQRGIDKGIDAGNQTVVVQMALLYVLCVIGTTLSAGGRVAL